MKWILAAALSGSLLGAEAVAGPVQTPEPARNDAAPAAQRTPDKQDISAESERVITLRSGAVHRGTLIEMVAGQFAALRLSDGRRQRFEWADIQRITMPGAILPAQPADAGESAHSAPMYVELRGEPQANLYLYSRNPQADSDWQKVCSYPCRQAIDPSQRYRVDGRDIVASEAFNLPPASLATLTVKGGNLDVRRGGKALVGVGVVLALVAIPLIFLDNADFCFGVPCKPVVRPPLSERPLSLSGYSMVGVGAASIAGGALMIGLTGTTVDILGISLKRSR